MTNTINFLNNLSKEVHQNAVEHGWWEEEISFGEVIALIHSELSEALEEYRNGHAVTEIYYNGDKPEGVPVELADVVIRWLDVLHKHNIKLVTPKKSQFDEYLEKLESWDIGSVIADLHHDVATTRFDNCVCKIALWFKQNGLDFESTILLKHEYNKTRPYKHGGKVI